MDDAINIVVLCLLLGLGVGVTIITLLAYVAALAFMEDNFD